MRLLLVVVSPYVGGAEIVMRDIAAGLAGRAGWRVEVCVAHEPVRRYYEGGALDVLLQPVDERLAQAREDVDVVVYNHYHAFRRHSLPRSRAGFRQVLVNHDIAVGRRDLPRLRLASGRLDLVVHVSQAALGARRRTYAGAARQVAVLNGHRDFRQLVGAVEKERLIVCAGSFHRPKGQDVLLAGVAGIQEQVRELGYRVRIVGQALDRAYLDELQRLSADLGLSDLVSFGTDLPREEALQEIARATLLIAPSRSWESLPNTLIEASFLEALPLGTDVGGTPEITPYVVAPDDATALAELLSTCLGWPAREAAERAATQRAEALVRFGIDRAVEEYAALLESLVSR